MLNLASSFRLRNRLKERIADFSDTIRNAVFSKTTGTEENTSPCDGKSITEAIDEVNSLMELLRDLNMKIEKVNTANRENLIFLETLKSKIAFYGRIVEKCRLVKMYEFEHDDEGERIKVDKEPLVDQGYITTVLATLRREKDILEEKINNANFSISVDFDPETVLSRL